MILQTCAFHIRSFDITYQKQRRRITPIYIIFVAPRKVWKKLSAIKKNVEILAARQQELCQYYEWDTQQAS